LVRSFGAWGNRGVLVDRGLDRGNRLGVHLDAAVAAVGETKLMRNDPQRLVHRHHDVRDRRKVLLSNGDATRVEAP
jgi:hypothetical protein